MFKICTLLVCFLVFYVESYNNYNYDSGNRRRHNGYGNGYGHGGNGGNGGNNGNGGNGNGGNGNGGNNGGNGNYQRPNQGCGNGWNGFNRPSGRWCLKVLGGTVEQPLAEDRCSEYGATLSSFMNAAELQAVNADALTVIAPRTTGSIWLGMKRTNPCLTQGQNAQCTADNSFYYTDGSTTGTAGLFWDISQSQPDNAYGHAQPCVDYLVAQSAGQTVSDAGYQWMTQKMDDVQCNTLNGEGPRKMLGYLCGRRAQ